MTSFCAMRIKIGSRKSRVHPIGLCLLTCTFKQKKMMELLDLATAQLSTFQAWAGQSFQLAGLANPVALELAQCRSIVSPWPGGKREAFALDFRGAPGLRLPQSIYRFENDNAAFEIFITQVGDGPKGSEFEAVFA